MHDEPHPGDVVAAEHWCSSGFANTDMDLILKKHGIQKLFVMGLIEHTCVEATVTLRRALSLARNLAAAEVKRPSPSKAAHIKNKGARLHTDGDWDT